MGAVWPTIRTTWKPFSRILDTTLSQVFSTDSFGLLKKCRKFWTRIFFSVYYVIGVQLRYILRLHKQAEAHVIRIMLYLKSQAECFQRKLLHLSRHEGGLGQSGCRLWQGHPVFSIRCCWSGWPSHERGALIFRRPLLSQHHHACLYATAADCSTLFCRTSKLSGRIFNTALQTCSCWENATTLSYRLKAPTEEYLRDVLASLHGGSQRIRKTQRMHTTLSAWLSKRRARVRVPLVGSSHRKPVATTGFMLFQSN